MFALYNLPFLVFKMITDSLRPIDMVKLSMTKKVLHERLTQYNYRPKTAKYFVDLGRKTVVVEFEDEESNFDLSFNGTSSGPFTVDVQRVEILTFVRRLQELFPGPIAHLQVDLGAINAATLEKLENIKCEKLSVTGAVRRIPKVVEMLSKIRVVKEINVEANIGTCFFRSPPTDKLSMMFATGMTQTDLMKLAGKTRSIELLETKLTPEMMNVFINNWLSGSETTTTLVRISREEEWNLAEVLMGIPLEKFNKSNRDRQFVTSRSSSGVPLAVQNMNKGLDIQRSDGLLATISATGPDLTMCVWHQKFEIKSIATRYATEGLSVQTRVAQLDRDRETVEQKMFENAERIQTTNKQIDKALQHFRRLLRDDVKDLEEQNQKLYGELEAIYSRINEAEEEKVRVARKLKNVLSFM